MVPSYWRMLIPMNSLTQEIQAHYDEVQRQLQVTLDQYGIAQRKLQSVTAELEEIRGNYEAVCSKLHLVTLLTTLSRILWKALFFLKFNMEANALCLHRLNTHKCLSAFLSSAENVHFSNRACSMAKKVRPLLSLSPLLWTSTFPLSSTNITKQELLFIYIFYIIFLL